MSRAFVKEPDGDQVSDDQPEWPVSEHTNFVTKTGLNMLQARRDNLLLMQTALKDDASMSAKVELGQVERELRYLAKRIASAKVVMPPQDLQQVKIGAQITVIDEDEQRHQFTIVGEDEADIKHGKISWVSPLANALLDKYLGDEVMWKRPSGDLLVEIEQVSYD